MLAQNDTKPRASSERRRFTRSAVLSEVMFVWVLGFSGSLACQYTIFGLPFEDSMVEVCCFYHKNELDYAAGCMQVSNAFSLSISAASPVLASLNPQTSAGRDEVYRRAAGSMCM